MKENRRSFFKWSLALGAIGLTAPAKAMNNLGSLGKVTRKPIIISTWQHGMDANKKAWEVLGAKGSALDAVEQGAREVESQVENKSVGIGGLPDELGKVTLDACIMDHNHKCGSVAFLQDIEHPISVARKVMEDTQHVMLVGEGAKKFALEKGFEKKNLLSKSSKEDYKKWKASQDRKKPEVNHENHDTIGLLAMDEAGNISGACTTSGWAYKLHGRVGDSPIIGAGLYVDNEVGGAVATGLGEAVIRVSGSHLVVELMRQGKSPQEACQLAVERIISKQEDLTGLQVGFLALNKKGEVGAYSVFNGFNYGLKSKDQDELIDAPFNRKW